MSPRPITRPENILPGDHETMTEPQKRGHYSRGCSHAACRRANADYQRDRMAAKRAQKDDTAPPAVRLLSGVRVPARGATRRVQGLMRVGHSPVAIALATQIGVDNIWWLALAKPTDVDETTHRVLDRAFKRMREQLPEPRAKTVEAAQQVTAWTREVATEHGWAGPFDWDDIDNDAAPHHGYARGEHVRRTRRPTNPEEATR